MYTTIIVNYKATEQKPKRKFDKAWPDYFSIWLSLQSFDHDGVIHINISACDHVLIILYLSYSQAGVSTCY